MNALTTGPDSNGRSCSRVFGIMVSPYERSRVHFGNRIAGDGEVFRPVSNKAVFVGKFFALTVPAKAGLPTLIVLVKRGDSA
jgi:hypothetical protein